MAGVVVCSVAAGRARLTVPWVRARPGSAGLVDERLTGIAGFRALRIFPRTGSVVIWVAPDRLDVERLVAALEEAPPPSAPAKATRSAPDSSTGEVARLVVGGAVLALVALRRLLRRPRMTFGSSGFLGAITLFTGLPFFRGALRSLRSRSSPGTDTLVMVADALGITEVHAHALPEGKLQLIRDLQAEGHTVAMVGDGTNDAPALALADVGISMGEHSSHVALETADIALAGNDLRQVAAVVELSRHTLRVVRQNYGLAIGVNLLGLLAGAGGSMNPVLAALPHNTSSIAVVGNSARLVNHTPHLPRTTDEVLTAAPMEDRRVR
ncbi:HAD-IC family P-type ATPase [Streptomyces sp. NPDC000880]